MFAAISRAAARSGRIHPVLCSAGEPSALVLARPLSLLQRQAASAALRIGCVVRPLHSQQHGAFRRGLGTTIGTGAISCPRAGGMRAPAGASTPLRACRRRSSSDTGGGGGGAKAEGQGAVTVVEDSYSELDIARNLPTYGPAATAGYSVLTFGMLAFALTAAGYLFMEIFSTSAPQRVMDLALEKTRENKQVEQLIGSPIEGFGEVSGRGRTRRITSEAFESSEGKPMMAVRFYVKGSTGQGQVTAQAETLPGWLPGFGGSLELRRCWMDRTHVGHSPARQVYRVSVV